MTYVKRLLAATAALTFGALAAHADADNHLAVAIGEPGSDSFTFGTELWAMSQIALMPPHGIAFDSREVAADQDRLSLLQNQEVEAALVYGRVPNAYDDDVRAIMALWPRGIVSEEADPVQFLVRKDVDAEVVYLVTKALFEHAGYFKTAHASLGIGRASEAMIGLDIPLHAGAYRYYQENGFGPEADVALDPWTDPEKDDDAEPGQATATYRNFDDAALEPTEVEQVARACRQALETGSLSLVLGDLATTGCEIYQDELIDPSVELATDTVQPQAVAAFATSVQAAGDEGSEVDLFASPVGQGGPAIRWDPAEGPPAVAERHRSLRALPTRVVHQPTM